MRVLGNRVLVKRLEEKALTSSVIELVTLGNPDPALFALVFGVGPGRRLENGDYIPIEVKTGDLVVLKKYSGTPVRIKTESGIEEDLQLVDGDDVLGILKQDMPLGKMVEVR